MTNYIFTTYITINAESHDEAIDSFDFKMKYGIDRSNIYVSEIEKEKSFSEM